MASESAETPRNGRLIAIGNFDGVHLGHRHLLSFVVEEARRHHIVPTVLTFDPHPAEVLGRGAPQVLTRLARKLELLRAISPALEVIVQPFDRVLSQSSPRQFAELLTERHAARQVVVGRNFRFGRERAGNLETLENLGKELGFLVRATELFSIDAEVVSSSRIRRAINAADLALARRLLGRPHRLQGRVVSGDGRGRKLGFPTANLEDVEELLPPHGVYAVRVVMEAAVPGTGAAQPSAKGILNVGVRPTFGPGAVTVEVHVFEHESDLVGATLKLDLVSRLREERRFPDVAALQAQIGRDIELAKSELARSEH